MRLSNKTLAVLSAWVICTSIHVCSFAGWLELPPGEAAQFYAIAWVACTNAVFTLFIQSSRLAFVTLISGWGITMVLCMPSIDILPNEYAVNFFALFVSTLVGVNFGNVHISLYGGSYNFKEKQLVSENNWNLAGETKSKRSSDPVFAPYQSDTNGMHSMDTFVNPKVPLDIVGRH